MDQDGEVDSAMIRRTLQRIFRLPDRVWDDGDGCGDGNPGPSSGPSSELAPREWVFQKSHDDAEGSN